MDFDPRHQGQVNEQMEERKQIEMIGPMSKKNFTRKGSYYANNPDREMDEILQNHRRANINDKSVSEILSSLNGGTPSAAGDLFSPGNIVNLTEGCIEPQKKLTVSDEDFIKITRMVEEYDKKQSIMNYKKEKIRRRKLALEQQASNIH